MLQFHVRRHGLHRKKETLIVDRGHGIERILAHFVNAPDLQYASVGYQQIDAAKGIDGISGSGLHARKIGDVGLAENCRA